MLGQRYRTALAFFLITYFPTVEIRLFPSLLLGTRCPKEIRNMSLILLKIKRKVILPRFCAFDPCVKITADDPDQQRQ
jgi:hypothetical protein